MARSYLNNNGRDNGHAHFFYITGTRDNTCINRASANHHLARPLVAASNDVKSLGEVNGDALIGTHTDNLDLLTRDGVHVEHRVAVASGEDDAPLSTLGCRPGCCGLDALRQEIVGRRRCLADSNRQQANYYVEHTLHLVTSFRFNLQR